MTKSFRRRVQCTIPCSPFPWSLQFFPLLSVIEKKHGVDKVKHSWLTAGVTEERFDHPQHLDAVAAQSRDVQGSRDAGWRGGVHDLTALTSTCHCLSNVLPLKITKKHQWKKHQWKKNINEKNINEKHQWKTSMKKTPMKNWYSYWKKNPKVIRKSKTGRVKQYPEKNMLIPFFLYSYHVYWM